MKSIQPLVILFHNLTLSMLSSVLNTEGVQKNVRISTEAKDCLNSRSRVLAFLTLYTSQPGPESSGLYYIFKDQILLLHKTGYTQMKWVEGSPKHKIRMKQTQLFCEG